VEEMGKADMMVICELFLEIGEKKNGWVLLLVSWLLDSAVYREGMN